MLLIMHIFQSRFFFIYNLELLFIYYYLFLLWVPARHLAESGGRHIQIRRRRCSRDDVWSRSRAADLLRRLKNLGSRSRVWSSMMRLNWVLLFSLSLQFLFCTPAVVTRCGLFLFIFFLLDVDGSFRMRNLDLGGAERIYFYGFLDLQSWFLLLGVLGWGIWM